MKNKIGVLITGFTVLSSLMFSSVAFAQTTPPSTHVGWARGSGHAPGVFGTVTSVGGGANGDTITVASKGFGQNATPTTYTVDATNATITKGGTAGAAPTTITVSGIAVGDTVIVRGTVSGQNVTATAIRDGVMGARAGVLGQKPQTPLTQGDGQPVVGGTVTANSGTSLTITNKGNVTYTVDITNAKILKGNTTAPASAVAVGDMVVIQGTVNGNSVVASSVLDSGASTATANASSTPSTHQGGLGGIFGRIGRFFQRLFGFF